jgi:hypothetical protein
MVAARRNRRGGGGGGGGTKAKPTTKPTGTVTETVPEIVPPQPLVASGGNVRQFPLSQVSLSPIEERVFRAVTDHYARTDSSIEAQLAIGRALGMSKSRVSEAFSGLERKGKVRRKKNGKFNQIELIARPVGYGGSRYASANA